MPHGDIRMLAPLYRLLPHDLPNESSDQIAETLRSARITHLIMSDSAVWIGNQPEEIWKAVFSPDFTRTWLDPVYAWRDLRLYRLRSHREEKPEPRISIGTVKLSEHVTSLAVSPEQLLEFYVAATPCFSAQDASVDINWLNQAGKVLFIEHRTIPPGVSKNWHSWLQSVPAGATVALFYPSSSARCLDLDVRLLLPRPLP
jgi:hypothetical protein